MNLGVKIVLLSCILNTQTSQKKGTDLINIKVTQGKTKPITFNVISSPEFQNISKTLKFNLEQSKRFIFNTKKEGNDVSILIRRDVNKKIVIEIKDNITHKTIKSFSIKNFDKNSELKVCNKVYKILTGEPGIFEDKLIITVSSKKNSYNLYQLDSNLTNLKKISSKPIYNALDIFLCDGKIFLSQFQRKDKAFAILYFNPQKQTYYEVFKINSASVYAPVVDDREIYIAVSDNGTTGIYKTLFTGSKQYKSFSEFRQDPSVTTVTKVNNRIATNPTVENGRIAFCADYNGRPSIYVYPHRRISSNDGSYFDPSLKNNNLAAIKIANGQFHLVLINLKNGMEKKLLTKFFIGRPTWSPCGNWIAVSCRDSGQKDIVLLVHITGKYIMKIQTNHKIKNILWMKGK